MSETWSRANGQTKLNPRQDHPLVGVWEEDEDPDWASSVVYTIRVRRGRFVVDAVDTSDGEKLKISSVVWNGRKLTFDTLCPSTKHKVKHVFWMKRTGLADHQLEYAELETWKKRSEEPPKSE